MVESKARKKLVSFILKKYADLTDREVNSILSDVSKLVRTVHKIYTEPQAKIYIKEIEREGQIVKKKVVEIDYKEFLKVKNKKEAVGVTKAFKRLNDSIEGSGYARK